jgi:hypothetical protein
VDATALCKLSTTALVLGYKVGAAVLVGNVLWRIWRPSESPLREIVKTFLWTELERRMTQSFDEAMEAVVVARLRGDKPGAAVVRCNADRTTETILESAPIFNDAVDYEVLIARREQCEPGVFRLYFYIPTGEKVYGNPLGKISERKTIASVSMAVAPVSEWEFWTSNGFLTTRRQGAVFGEDGNYRAITWGYDKTGQGKTEEEAVADLRRQIGEPKSVKTASQNKHKTVLEHYWEGGR